MLDRLQATSPALLALPANDVAMPSRVDARVERALELMRDQPGEPWTVERLARSTGCSRATFARRFAAATGTSPLAFLTLVRLHGAARQLAHSDAGLAAIAAASGYGTEFAFGRAFKRCFCVPPGVFRRAIWQQHSSAAIRNAA